jgi:hypothetical protein
MAEPLAFGCGCGRACLRGAFAAVQVRKTCDGLHQLVDEKQVRHRGSVPSSYEC